MIASVSDRLPESSICGLFAEMCLKLLTRTGL